MGVGTPINHACIALALCLYSVGYFANRSTSIDLTIN